MSEPLTITYVTNVHAGLMEARQSNRQYGWIVDLRCACKLKLASRRKQMPKAAILFLRCVSAANRSTGTILSIRSLRCVRMQHEKCSECMFVDAAMRQTDRPFARRATTVKSPTYDLRSNVKPEFDAVKQCSGRYNTALPLVSKTPKNACCEKRNRCDAHDGGACRSIKHIRRTQTDNGRQHPDHTSGYGHAFGCA
ncbi:MAG: hypothetical protein ACI8TF_002903 [Paracoccaceae bacterium]|jgi:hypothetical protein